MTRRLAIPFAACLFSAIATAQEIPEQVAPKPAETVPAEEPAGEPSALIPELPPVSPPAKPAPAEPKKKSSTEQESDDLQARIRYREVKTKALRDPKIQQEWDRAEAAKTDPEKREYLKSYYKLLCDRMVKIDSSVKPRVDALRKSLVWRLEPGLRQRAKLVRPVEEVETEEPQPQIR
jgi:hypothetical protein